MARRRESVFDMLFSALRSFFIARNFDRQRSIGDIRAMSWRQFESIVGEAFKRRGFIVETARGGSDSGVDLVLRKGGSKYLVQCRQWKASKVGGKPVRELFGVVAAQGAAGGFFVTSGTYSSEARDFARQCTIELIDGVELEQMVLEARRQEPFLDPTVGREHTLVKAQSKQDPRCPKCGGAMVLRTAQQGANIGRDFWGCIGFPTCRGTRD